MSGKKTNSAEEKSDNGKPKGEVKIQVECQGKSPLLMQAMSVETIVNVLIRRQRQPAKTDLSLEEMAETCLYRENGNIGIPATNLFSCLIEAGRHVAFSGKTKISTKDSTLLPSFLSIEEMFLPLTGAGKWKPDVRRGQMKDGTAVGIVRPMFKEWGFKVTLMVDLSETTEATVKRLLEIAGRRVGLCSFRPQKRGPFGQFKISKWKVMGDN